MIDVKVILLVSLAVALSADETRNFHAPCEILINEFSTSNPAFAEIGKFCASTRTPNTHETLGGYNLIIVDSQDLTVVYYRALDRMKLKTRPWNRSGSKAAKVPTGESGVAATPTTTQRQSPVAVAVGNSPISAKGTASLRPASEQRSSAGDVSSTGDNRQSKTGSTYPGNFNTQTMATTQQLAEGSQFRQPQSPTAGASNQPTDISQDQVEPKILPKVPPTNTGQTVIPSLNLGFSFVPKVASASSVPINPTSLHVQNPDKGKSTYLTVTERNLPAVRNPAPTSSGQMNSASAKGQASDRGQSKTFVRTQTNQPVGSKVPASSVPLNPTIVEEQKPDDGQSKTSGVAPNFQSFGGKASSVSSALPPMANSNGQGSQSDVRRPTVTQNDQSFASERLVPIIGTQIPSGSPTHQQGQDQTERISTPSKGACKDEHCPSPPKRSRQKRAAEEEQQNLWGLVDVDLANTKFDPEKSYAVLLVYYPHKMRSGLWDKFKVGSKLRDEVKAELQRYTADALLVSPSTPTGDPSPLVNILPPGTDLIFVDLEDTQTDISASKCDAVISPFNPDGFTHAARTRGQPNTCPAVTWKFPFTFQRKVLRKQTQEVIVNAVMGLSRHLHDPDWQKLSAQDAAAAILNLSSGTVNRILSKFYGGHAFEDGKKRCRSRPTTDLSHTEQKILYDIIISYYAKNRVPRFASVMKEFITKVREARLREIEESHISSSTTTRPLESTSEDPVQNGEVLEDWDTERTAPGIYHCSAKSFSKILDKYGYKYGKIKNRDSQIFRPVNIEWRTMYLDAIAKYDADPEWTVIYQDETWIDPHQRADRGWVLKRFENFQQRLDFTFKDSKISRGTRLIVLAAGGSDGFVQEATTVFAVPVNSKKSKSCNEGTSSCTETLSEDYHDNVKGPYFLQWLENLFKTLKDKGKKSVVVMDNCPYHKVLAVPKTSDKKEDIRQWLETKKSEGLDIAEDVTLGTKLTKVQLLAIVKRLTDEQYGDQRVPRTKIQQLADKYGHRILHIPPYNCDLNPIEYVWSDVKREVKEKNTEQTVAHALTLAKHEMRTYPKENWVKHISHTKRLEKNYREGDKILVASRNVDQDEESAVALTEADLQIIDNELGVIADESCDED